MSTKASEEESHHDESDITDEFIDDDGDKSGYFPGKTITLQMLLGANVLQPGKGAMSIEYLGQKFIGDLLADGKIKSHETETIFCSPSAWAIYCKRIINPDKRSSGCGWASVKYKGKKLDAYKAAYHRKLLQKEKEDHKDDGPDVEIIEDTEEDKTAMEPPPVRRNVVQHNTISNRNILHDANTLIESVPFTSVGKIQPFLLSVSSSTILVMDFHCHLTNNEVCGYLGGTWDINAHNLSITHAFPCRNSRFDRDKAAMCELQIQKLMVKKNLHLVGWYHSHPRFPVQPTLRDCDAQLEYQIKMRGPTEASYTPCVGFICSPYNDVNNALESSILSFWVLPPPENRPAEYGRPMLMSYSLVQDETLSEEIKEEMMLTVDYYKQFNRELINFQGIYKNEVSYIDKLKKTLAPKLPLDSRSGHFWNWIRELLGLDPEEIVVIPDPPPPPPPMVPKLPEPISGGSSMVVNLTGPDEGSVGTDTKNDEDFDGVSEMGDSDVISLKDDDNKAVSLGVPSLQAQLKRPSGLNMTPSPLSSSLVVLPTNLSQANPPAVANASNNHGGSITTNTSSPRDSPITIPSNSASPAKFEIPVRASPSPAKSDTSSCRSRTRNSPAPSPVKLSIGDILGSGNRNSPTLSSLIGNMGGNVSNIHDLYAATFASLGTSIPSNLLSQDYASLFQNTKRDEYGLSALNALAQVAAASGISNTQINETLLHSLNRSIGSSSSGKSGQTSTVTTSSATMSSSTAPSASSSSSAAASSAAAAAAAAAAVASSTGLPPIPNMKEFMQQLEKGNLSLLMQSQYANPLAGMTGLTGQAGSGGTSSGKSGSSRSSGKSRSKAAQAQQAQQQQLQQAQQQLLQQQQQQHQSLMDYADFTSKFDQGKLADLMKSPEYSQMLLQQAQALGSLGSEISIIKKPSSKGNSSNSGNNSGNNNSSNNNSSNNAGSNAQSAGNKKDSASDLITKLRTIFSTDSYLPPMPTAADINLLAEQSQKVPEIQQILNSGNLDDIQVLLKAQSLSNNTLDFALFMQGTSGTNAGAGEGSSKASKSAAAKEEREREREREREQRERDNANAAAAAAAAAAMNPYLSASNLSALFEPVQRTTSEKSSGKSSKNKGGNTGSQTNAASNPADMLNSLFTSAVGGTSAADMNALLYGQGKGAPDLSMLFGGVSSAATTSSTSSTTSTAAAAAAAAKQSLDYLSMFPNFSAAKLPEMSALFQSDKFEIPDPLAKATLEANNMYLAPSASLLKLQQEAFNSMMMKPPKSSSSSTSSSSKIETPPPIVASPGARSTPTKSANRDSPSLPKYNFSAVDLAVSSVPLAASSPLGGVADLSRKTPQTPPVDMSASPSISSTPPVSGSASASSQILPPYKKRMEFSSIADLVAAPPSKMPKMSTENLDP